MQLELAQKICEIAADYCYIDADDTDTVKLRESYRGRGCSKETVGIVGLTPLKLAQIVIENAGEFVDEDGDPLFSLSCLQVDNMGLSHIIY
jgi:hypothetical protein